MQRLLFITGSILALTACSSMDGMTKHHHTPYAKLADIAKKYDAQQALLQTRQGNFIVVNVATGEIVEPDKGQKNSAAGTNEQPKPEGVAATHAPISDEEFADVKRRFEHTITTKVTRGSVCLTDVINGQRYMLCSPPEPRFW